MEVITARRTNSLNKKLNKFICSNAMLFFRPLLVWWLPVIFQVINFVIFITKLEKRPEGRSNTLA